MKTLGCHTLCYRNATLAAKAMFAAYNQRDAANHTHTHTLANIFTLWLLPHGETVSCCHGCACFIVDVNHTDMGLHGSLS